jgi:hypothetical protein
MILVDLNQVMISNLMQQIRFSPGGLPEKYTASNVSMLDPDLIRHMILNSLRSYRAKFHKEYGELIICCDDKNYWRKDIFPYYKAHRKKDREKSGLDWNVIFGLLNDMRDDLKEYFPYKVIQIDRAEADDIIAAICWIHGSESMSYGEKILILSSDKDFVQLQRYGNVSQYSPMQKKMINHVNPSNYIREHILKGDRGDGIPNFLSDDDTFIQNKRQKPIRREKLEKWIHMNPEEFCNEEMLRGYRRNEALVDLSKIPDWIHGEVNDIYENYEEKDRSLLMNYFIRNKMKNLMEHIQEF